MNQSYYYIIASLPDLSLNDKETRYAFGTFRLEVQSLLKESDWELLKVLYYPADIRNFGKVLIKESEGWDDSAIYSKNEWETLLQDTEGLPTFFTEFLEEHGNKKWEEQDYKYILNEVSAKFINWSRQLNNTFLRKWLHFEHNLKNLLIWLNSTKFNLDLKNEILGDYYEANFLKTIDTQDINLKAWDYSFREVLGQYNNENIALREYVLDEMKWKYLEELAEPHPFGIEAIMTFAIKLQIINRNIVCTERAGKKRLEKILYDIKKNYEIPTQL